MQYKGLSITDAPSLAGLTTIRLGGTAIAKVTVEDPKGLEALPQALADLGGKPVMLGRGSNILARSGKLPLVLVALGRAFDDSMPQITGEEKGKTLVEASAATPLPLLLGKMVAGGLGGLTGLAGVPGQVGGAVAMNAGSFGHELKDCLHEVTLFSPVLGLVTLPAHELELAYRHFSIPALRGVADGSGWFLITRAVFACPQQKPEDLKAHVQSCFAKKRASQPIALPSAGCVFKNPQGDAAGRLLDVSGFKGRRFGGMAFSGIHANFLVNEGGGTPEEAFALIEDAVLAVQARFGVGLELEVKVWP